MRLVTSPWMDVRRSSTFSIFVATSPVSPRLSVMLASWWISWSRSFSCSFRTFTMKSMASRASSLVGFFAKSLSPCACIVNGLLGK